MADLKYTYLNPMNGTLVTKYPYNSTTKYTTPSLCYRDSSNTRYVPLITPTGYVDIDNYRYSYDSSVSKSIHCYYNSTEYVVPNKSTAISEYDIPAGTYTPSAFRNLIEQYISNNGNRTVANDFTVKVNGQTISISSGQKVYYAVNSSSPQGMVRSVLFNPSSVPASGFAPPITYNSSSNGFTNGHCYVVYFLTAGFNYTSLGFGGYANYNITVTTGIKFS